MSLPSDDEPKENTVNETIDAKPVKDENAPANEPDENAEPSSDSSKTSGADPAALIGDLLGKALKDMPALFGGAASAASGAVEGINPSEMIKAAGGVMKSMKETARKKIDEIGRAHV